MDCERLLEKGQGTHPFWAPFGLNLLWFSRPATTGHHDAPDASFEDRYPGDADYALDQDIEVVAIANLRDVLARVT